MVLGLLSSHILFKVPLRLVPTLEVCRDDLPVSCRLFELLLCPLRLASPQVYNHHGSEKSFAFRVKATVHTCCGDENHICTIRYYPS